MQEHTNQEELLLSKSNSFARKARYTNPDIVSIEDANRTKYNSADQIAVWAFFVDGESASNNENGVILGTAYRKYLFCYL
jgi:hypothetical protein